jgi:hypothetical protein
MTQLRKLSLKRNSISELPPEIARMVCTERVTQRNTLCVCVCVCDRGSMSEMKRMRGRSRGTGEGARTKRLRSETRVFMLLALCVVYFEYME